MKYMLYLNKRMNTNPRRGPFHHRAPAMMLQKAIRGMLPHKTKRGQAALGRLSVFEGVPTQFATKKRVVIPSALRVLRLKPGVKSTHLGTLAETVGWKHQEAVKKLEAERKVKGKVFFLRKQAMLKIQKKARDSVKDKIQSVAEFGY
jgi:large subunit ribosomal protein L13Ae